DTISTNRPTQAFGNQSCVVSFSVLSRLPPVDLSARRRAYHESTVGSGNKSGPASVSVLALLPVIFRTWPGPGPATISTTRSRHWSGCQRWVVSFRVVPVAPVTRACVPYTLVSLGPFATTYCEVPSGSWFASQVPAMVRVLASLSSTSRIWPAPL